MTEDEAKTKWCCANMSFPVKVSVAYQAQPVIEYTQKCQGSQCMAWRETTERKLEPSPKLTTALVKEKVTGGYCGLAR